MRNKMIDLHNALFAELEALQDEESYRDAEGNFDKARAEAACRRAEKVSEVAGKIMDLQRLQLDVVKTAYDNGIDVKIPDVLGIEERKKA